MKMKIALLPMIWVMLVAGCSKKEPTSRPAPAEDKTTAPSVEVKSPPRIPETRTAPVDHHSTLTAMGEAFLTRATGGQYYGTGWGTALHPGSEVKEGQRVSYWFLYRIGPPTKDADWSSQLTVKSTHMGTFTFEMRNGAWVIEEAAIRERIREGPDLKNFETVRTYTPEEILKILPASGP